MAQMKYDKYHHQLLEKCSKTMLYHHSHANIHDNTIGMPSIQHIHQHSHDNLLLQSCYVQGGIVDSNTQCTLQNFVMVQLIMILANVVSIEKPMSIFFAQGDNSSIDRSVEL
jgi:hypothetical protein